MARWLSWSERRPVTAKVVGLNQKNRKKCTSGSVVEYRLAKARVAGSNPVSCSVKVGGNLDFIRFLLFCLMVFLKTA